MKKFLAVLGLVTCVLGLTACGSKAETETASAITQEDAVSVADGLLSQIDSTVTSGSVDAQLSQITDKEQAEVLKSVFSTWESSLKEMGTYQGIVADSVEVTQDGDYTITTDVTASERNAEVAIVIAEDGMLSSITVSPVYTTGEKMEKAALNTLMGMGTVFVVLILISLIISCFKLIPSIQNMFTKKQTKTNNTSEQAVDNTIAQIIENEELSDDTELVAVIAAAIAVSEGAASTDGFVVRSIKRASTNKWQRA